MCAEIKELLSYSKLTVHNPDSMTFEFSTKDGGRGILDISGSPTSDDVCEVLEEIENKTPQVISFVEKFKEEGVYYDLAESLADYTYRHDYNKYEVVIQYENENAAVCEENTGVVYYSEDDKEWCENRVQENLDDYIDTDEFDVLGVISKKELMQPLSNKQRDIINNSIKISSLTRTNDLEVN